VSPPAFHRFRAFGTAAVVGVADPDRLAAAVDEVRDEIEACDLACSRFRPDSELSQLNDLGRLNHQGRRSAPWQAASGWLCDALEVAVRAARDTGGLVDPTLGRSLVELGYDRSFEDLAGDQPPRFVAAHVPAWQDLLVDRSRLRVQVPAGVVLDLGATAKALCADRAAARASAATATGVLVSLGGDIAVAGPAPEDGWIVRVTDRADTPPDAPVPGQTVAIREGGLATSGTSARRWTQGGAERHHLLDPASGRPAAETWRTVTVAAADCVQANVAATGAVVLGRPAPIWLHRRRLDARLVTRAGEVLRVGSWPVQPSLGAAS